VVFVVKDYALAFRVVGMAIIMGELIKSLLRALVGPKLLRSMLARR
jgi:hypothetical protein